jgi:hypothetical protein
MAHTHILKGKKLKIELMDTIAKGTNWNITGKKGYERTYQRGNDKIEFLRVNVGYKVILSKNGKIHDADVTKNREEAFTLLGESLMFRKW